MDARWTEAIDRVVAGRDVAVAVGLGERIVYLHRGRISRVLASNEKLLTSMAALDIFGSRHRFPTMAAADARVRGGLLRGDLWLIGAGDPELTAARLAMLAARLHALGVRRITGSIVGDTSAFDRGWWAPGWLPGISRSYVTRPTALAIDGNRDPGSPERRAASALRTALRALGVRVDGGALAGLRVRAKTGTLFVRPASALSGYVGTAAGTTVAFSVLTAGYGSGEAEPIEDAIVRILAGARISV